MLSEAVQHPVSFEEVPTSGSGEEEEEEAAQMRCEMELWMPDKL